MGNLVSNSQANNSMADVVAEYDEVDLPGTNTADSNEKCDNKVDTVVECGPVSNSYDDISDKIAKCLGNKPERNDETAIDENYVEVTGDKLTLRKGLNSLSTFYEKYEDLDETDYPHPDPGANPECESDRKLTGIDLNDFPHMGRSKGKTKVEVRWKTKIDGIVSTHTTYFPQKREDAHVELNYKKNTASECYYDMSSFPRGILTVFNVEYYHQKTGMSDYPRKGTERDADGLVALFLELGFIVERYDNPNKEHMFEALDLAAEECKNLSCCACAILTHGEERILYSSDKSLEVKDITKCFRKKSLAGKPKLFFFQACQGSDYMDAIDSVDAPVHKDTDLSLPCEADFFYAYSTVPGYYSWRNSRHGSWFMQALCNVFRQNAHQMDIYRMLTRVNDRVSARKSCTTEKATDDKRQIASIVSQMRKELFFFPPYGPLVVYKK